MKLMTCIPSSYIIALIIEMSPQSLDINQIKNLWDHLIQKVWEHAVFGKYELKIVLLQEL